MEGRTRNQRDGAGSETASFAETVSVTRLDEEAVERKLRYFLRYPHHLDDMIALQVIMNLCRARMDVLAGALAVAAVAIL